MLGANLIELLYARADLLCSIIIPSEIFLRKGNTKKGIGSTTLHFKKIKLKIVHFPGTALFS